MESKGSQKKYMDFTVETSGILEGLQASAQQLRNLKVIVICAMMIAVAVIVDQFSVSYGQYLRFGFSTHVNQVVYMLFGGAVGTVFGGVADVVKYFVKPNGEFQIAFMLNSMLAGLIYGMFYYKRKMTLLNIFIAQATVAIICNIVINTYLLVIFNGLKLEVILPIRIARNLIMVPINSLIFFYISTALQRAKIKNFLLN